MRIFLSILLLLFLLCSAVIGQTATTVVFNKDGWDVTSAYTSTLPAPAPGPTITAIVTFEVGGVIQTTTASDSFALPIPVIMTKRIATSNISLVNDYTITNITGDGTAVFDATSGKLVYTVNAPND